MNSDSQQQSKQSGTHPQTNAIKILPVISNKHPDFSHSKLHNLKDLFAGNNTVFLPPVHPQHLRLPKPIIVVGLPKAGTSSIFSFFHCNGLRSQHWYCCGPQDHPSIQRHNKSLIAKCMMNNLATNHLILKNCGNYEAFTELNGPRALLRQQKQQQQEQNSSHGEIYGVLLDDGTYDTNPPFHRLFLPQHYHLDKIHQQYPNATFILNKRPVQSWVSSVLSWSNRSMARPQSRETIEAQQQFNDIANQFFNEFRYNPILNTATSWSSKLFSKLLTTSNQTIIDEQVLETFLMELYHRHNQVVREFVINHPSHTLIEIDITHNDTGTILSNAFGLLERCWIHQNKNNKLQKRRFVAMRGTQNKSGTIRTPNDENLNLI